MIKKIEIKKELNESEFNEIAEKFQEKLSEPKKISELEQIFQELVKMVTPAKKVHLLKLSEQNDILETVGLEKNITLHISSSKNSMLGKCVQTKEALFSNDISRDTLYNEKVDNFLNYPLKNLLIAPLLSKKGELLGLIWAAIPLKDLNQYMQSDLEYIMKFSTVPEKILPEKNEPSDKEVLAEKVPLSIQENNDRDENAESMVKRLKSWIFG